MMHAVSTGFSEDDDLEKLMVDLAAIPPQDFTLCKVAAIYRCVLQKYGLR
jgi:hypothetical protein